MSGRKLRIGIHGFGRIGRAVARINFERGAFDLAAINDINPDVHNLAYLLKYDSTYGRYKGDVLAEGAGIVVDGRPPIRVSQVAEPGAAPWAEAGVDIVIDASGRPVAPAQLERMKAAGIRHVIVTNETPASVPVKPVIVGVNHESIAKSDFALSSCTCDANAFVPVMSILQESFGVEYGSLTTLHPWLGYQKLLDGGALRDSNPAHIQSTYVLGRNATQSLIPKTTSCIRASSRVLPWLDEKFVSVSYRTPTMIVSSADIVVKLERPTDAATVINAFEAFERKQRYQVINNGREALVSIDYAGTPWSAAIDHRWTSSRKAGQLKLILWYDNEWGYGSRVVDLVDHLAGLHA
jgi:glyceraldehyde 3-phosphate dehydrogenase